MTEPLVGASPVGAAKGRPGGYAIVAPAGTPLDALKDVSKTLQDLSESIPGAAGLGYISEDGVTITTDTDTEDRKDWSGSLIRSELTSFSMSMKTTFLESRESVLKTVFGDGNVAVEGKVRVTRVNQNFTSGHAFVFEHVIGGDIVRRTIVEHGVINERDDIELNSSDLLGYSPTIKCVSVAGRDPMVFLDFAPGDVVVPVTGVSLDKEVASIAVGGTVQLTATVYPELATDRSVTWTTSNAPKAAVSSSGLVTGKAATSDGSPAIVTCSSHDGTQTATCAVSVVAAG